MCKPLHAFSLERVIPAWVWCDVNNEQTFYRWWIYWFANTNTEIYQNYEFACMHLFKCITVNQLFC